jgi:hypothetical protein
MFFFGLALVTVSLLMLWLASWRKSQHSVSRLGATLKETDIEPFPVGCRGQLSPDGRPTERRGAA